MIRLCAFADEASPALDGQIAALKRNGLSLIEFRGLEGEITSTMSLEKARNAFYKFKENGISVWSIGSGLGKADITVDFEEYEKTVRHVCEIANVMQTDRIRMFSFWKAYDCKEKVFDYLNRMVKIGAEYGVYMCHENEGFIYGDNSVRVLEIKENVPGLRFIYDPANFAHTGEPADVTLDALVPFIDYFHIKDILRSESIIVPAGKGDGKLDRMIDMIDRDTVFTVEPHLRVFPGFSEVDRGELKNKYVYATNDDSFDAAVGGIKELLVKQGYREYRGGYVKY